MDSDDKGLPSSQQQYQKHSGQDDGHRQRIEALRSLASDQRSHPIASPPLSSLSSSLSPRRSRPVLLWLSIGAIVVILPASGAFLWLHPSRPQPVSTDPLVIRFPDGGIACPTEAAWSPNGKTIAVLGYTECGKSPQGGNGIGTAPTGGELAVYDSVSGTTITTIQLDAWLAPQIDVQSGATHNKQQVSYNYFHLLWAPDGQLAALLFDVVGMDEQGAVHDYGGGLLLIQVKHNTVDVHIQSGFLQAYQAARDSAFLSPGAPSTLRWDISSGAMATVQIPPALGYEWGQGDTLQPAQPLGQTPNTPPPAAPPGPIGNPLGGSRFSLWC